MSLEGRTLAVCIPAYDSKILTQVVERLFVLENLLRQNGAHIGILFCNSVSLVTMARNALFKSVMDLPQVTDVLLLDSDVVFRPDDVLDMMGVITRYDIIAGIYPLKTDGPPSFTFDYEKDDSGAGVFYEPEVLKCYRLPAGFMMISGEAIKKIWDAHEDAQYFSHGHWQRNIFDCEYRRGEQEYVGEDYVFCDKAIKQGLKMGLLTRVKLGHVGAKAWWGSEPEAFTKAIQSGSMSVVDEMGFRILEGEAE